MVGPLDHWAVKWMTISKACWVCYWMTETLTCERLSYQVAFFASHWIRSLSSEPCWSLQEFAHEGTQ